MAQTESVVQGTPGCHGYQTYLFTDVVKLRFAKNKDKAKMFISWAVVGVSVAIAMLFLTGINGFCVFSELDRDDTVTKKIAVAVYVSCAIGLALVFINITQQLFIRKRIRVTWTLSMGMFFYLFFFLVMVVVAFSTKFRYYLCIQIVHAVMLLFLLVYTNALARYYNYLKEIRDRLMHEKMMKAAASKAAIGECVRVYLRDNSNGGGPSKKSKR